ncbi:flagellar rod protein [Candidatus Photodesmus blepharus]|uniref:Flagellar rod protein n=1 Tax=Candidatus Photodesmus blepharonis TaxID=1179155 RepID=A0A084CP07_9GAMM|nr:flagellar protein FliT [Candidatus Photodesmus blepharus]KEY91536.1 flagellar rod protein [Candidatus Photodesmus blepharus]
MIELTDVRNLDNKIRSILSNKEIHAKEIIKLVDNREQILLKILKYIKETPNLSKSKNWVLLLEETKQLTNHLQHKTNQIGEKLKTYRYACKSIQKYEKI